MATDDELLDLQGVASRTEGVRFELRNVAGSVLGSITPDRVVQVENRSDGVLKRTVTNFNLSPSVAADVNPLSDRVAGYWRLSSGTEYPLGVFLFASWAQNRRSDGLLASTRLLDQGITLAQAIPTSIGFSEGTLVTTAIRTVFEGAGIFTSSIASAVPVLSSPLAWPAGTTWAKIASELCGLAGLSDWFFNNDGVLTVAALQDLSLATPDHVYAGGGRIIAGSLVEQNDLLDAPNRYIAIDTANRTQPIVGVYDLPNGAPNSFGVRGFRIARVIQAPGVNTPEAAAAYAQSYAQTDPKAYETVTFSSSPDPRHDTYDVVQYLGVNYQEISWRLRCAPGGPHEHTLKRVYYV